MGLTSKAWIAGLLIIFSGFVCASAGAAADYEFECKASPETTSFSLLADGPDTVLLTLKNKNGVGYMPIFDGLIVANDFPYLQEGAGLLSNFGRGTTYHFSKARCRVYGAGVVSCAGEDTKTFAGLQFRALSVSTVKMTRESMGTSTTYTKVVLSIQILDRPPVRDITMDFESSNCHFGNDIQRRWSSASASERGLARSRISNYPGLRWLSVF